MSDPFPCNQCFWLAKLVDESSDKSIEMLVQHNWDMLCEHVQHDHAAYKDHERSHRLRLILEAMSAKVSG